MGIFTATANCIWLLHPPPSLTWGGGYLQQRNNISAWSFNVDYTINPLAAGIWHNRHSNIMLHLCLRHHHHHPYHLLCHNHCTIVAAISTSLQKIFKRCRRHQPPPSWKNNHLSSLPPSAAHHQPNCTRTNVDQYAALGHRPSLRARHKINLPVNPGPHQAWQGGAIHVDTQIKTKPSRTCCGRRMLQWYVERILRSSIATANFRFSTTLLK